MWSSFVLRGGGISLSSDCFSNVTWSGAFLLPLDLCLFFLVDLTPCEDWTIFTFIVSTACGKYLTALVYVNSGHISKFLFLIALSHVD